MTIGSATSRMTYTGNGATTVYAYTFKIFEDADLRVTSTTSGGVETTLVLNTDYTVSGEGEATGGNVTLTTALASGSILTIRRVVDVIQETNISNGGDFYARTHEDKFDYLTMIDQQQQDEINRSVRLAESDTASEFNPILPAEIDGAVSKAPITNAAGTAWAAISAWPSATDISSASTYATQAAASAAASAVSAGTLSPYGINNLGLSASVAANAMTIAILEADGSSTPSTGTDSVTIYFRSSTLTSGAMTARSVTSATTIVIPAGATLGHNDGIVEYIHIYALDNAGTVELAVSSSSHWDEGERHSTTAIGTGSDDAATLYSTAARTDVAIRKIGRINVTQATAGTWASAITRLDVGFIAGERTIMRAQSANFIAKHGTHYLLDASSAIAVQLPAPRAGLSFWIKITTGTALVTLTRNGSEAIDGASANYILQGQLGSWRVISNGTNWFIERYGQNYAECVVITGNGFGSTNTAVRRFTTESNSGSPAIVYADSAGNGATFTIGANGIYSINYADGQAGAGSPAIFGITLNCAALTSGPDVLTYATGRRAVTFAENSKTSHCSWTGYLAAGDIVRAQANANVDRADDECYFSIVKIG